MIKLKQNIDLQATHEKFLKLITERNIYTERGVAPPFSFTPYVISKEKYEKLSFLCCKIYSAIDKIIKYLIKHNKTIRYFPELINYQKFLSICPQYKHWIHLARFDIVEDVAGEFKLLETNADCPPAGWL